MKTIMIALACVLLCACSKVPYQAEVTHYNLPGKITASGEPFDATAMAAAHPWIEFGTWIRVETVDRQPHTVIFVRINDRSKSTLDLTDAAFKKLAPLDAGKVITHYTIQE